MANAGKLIENLPPARMLIEGYPGTAKTGCIASLLNAGYKVRMIDFESNYAPLLQFTDPSALVNLDIQTFQDQYRMDHNDHMVPLGRPSSFNDAMRALKEWKYKDEDGTEVNLGSSHEWGRDTVIVVDSITANSEAVIRRTEAMANRKMQLQDYGAAVDDQLAFFQALARYNPDKPDYNGYHLVVLGHIQMIGPKEIEKKKNATEIDLTNQDIRMEAAELLPTRLYPIAATKNFSMKIGKEFSSIVVAEVKTVLGKPQRRLSCTLREEIDTKMPARSFKPDYPVETGLADIFSALGYKAPGLK
jgi:hypothetical protein